jgi:hypothetical protein
MAEPKFQILDQSILPHPINNQTPIPNLSTKINTQNTHLVETHTRLNRNQTNTIKPKTTISNQESFISNTQNKISKKSPWGSLFNHREVYQKSSFKPPESALPRRISVLATDHGGSGLPLVGSPWVVRLRVFYGFHDRSSSQVWWV